MTTDYKLSFSDTQTVHCPLIFKVDIVFVCCLSRVWEVVYAEDDTQKSNMWRQAESPDDKILICCVHYLCAWA